MELAGYAVNAVVLEGRSVREVAQGPRGVQELALRGAGPLPTGRRTRPGGPL